MRRHRSSADMAIFYIGGFADTLLKQIRELKDRLDVVEKNAGKLSYAGTYHCALRYSRGTCCTFDGSLWICLRGHGRGGSARR
jgi:hypothetical protein